MDSVHGQRLLHAARALKPADWLVITFLLVSLPLAIAAHVWSSVVVRLVLIPTAVFARWYFAHVDVNASLVTKALLLLLDVYPLVTCIYLYGEDGKTLAWLYPNREADFWDDAIKHADAALLGVPIETGAGAHLRARTSETFNRIIGEYLHFAYFAFYVILAGTPVFGWWCLQREHFDRLMTAQTLVYLVCCGAYLFFPTAGPYWAYPDQRPEPHSVGYFFSHLTHILVGGGSSIGTAFPSGHCSITTSAMIVSLVYMPRLFIVYIFIGPALVVATVWGGFHYFYDALFGVLLGLIGAVVGIAFARILRYTPPACDDKYSTSFRLRMLAFADGIPVPSAHTYYMHLPEFDGEAGPDSIKHSLGNKGPISYIPSLSSTAVQAMRISSFGSVNPAG